MNFRFTKKPVEIQAWFINNNLSDETGAIPVWVVAGLWNGSLRPSEEGLTVKTAEGEMLGRPGDWLIRGVEGELYPCKHSVFMATYDEVDDRSKEWQPSLKDLEELCGHVGDGSHTTVKISQDDATRTWHINVGSISYGGNSLMEALDAAVHKRGE